MVYDACVFLLLQFLLVVHISRGTVVFGHVVLHLNSVLELLGSNIFKFLSFDYVAKVSSVSVVFELVEQVQLVLF